MALEKRKKKKMLECTLQISFNADPPRSKKFTDDMFPLDDLVIVPEYSLDSMAYGERTVQKESPSMAEPFTLVEHDMCISEVDGSKKKNKNSLPVPTHPIQAQNKENLPKPPEDTRQKPNQILKELEPEDKDGLQNLSSLITSVYKFFSS